MLLHHYYPSFLPLSSIAMNTTAANNINKNTATKKSKFNDSLDDDENDNGFGRGNMTFNVATASAKKIHGGAASSSSYKGLIENEKDNFRVFHEKVRTLTMRLK